MDFERADASGHIRRTPAPTDKRAMTVELTESGRALADQVEQAPRPPRAPVGQVGATASGVVGAFRSDG